MADDRDTIRETFGNLYTQYSRRKLQTGNDIIKLLQMGCKIIKQESKVALMEGNFIRWHGKLHDRSKMVRFCNMISCRENLGNVL